MDGDWLGRTGVKPKRDWNEIANTWAESSNSMVELEHVSRAMKKMAKTGNNADVIMVRRMRGRPTSGRGRRLEFRQPPVATVPRANRNAIFL